jgi:hypothetical protein
VRKRNRALIFGGVALVAIIALVAVKFHGKKAEGPDNNQIPPKTEFFTQVALSNAPADVQAAAEALKSSRVGYAMLAKDKTYLIISTGSPDQRVTYDRSEGQPTLVDPSLADIYLTSALAGESLMVGTTPLTTAVEYQFNVDGKSADIPTLHNPHKLELTALDAKAGFSVLAPKAGMIVQGGKVHVEGYARVFESRFTATVTDAQGRMLGEAQVQAAAGYPSWGSFVAGVAFQADNLPETGFLVLSEEMSGAKLKIAIRFRPPAQMG